VLSQLIRYSDVGGVDSPDLTSKPVYFLINPNLYFLDPVKREGISLSPSALTLGIEGDFNR
jgi:hypothetical protein